MVIITVSGGTVQMSFDGVGEHQHAAADAHARDGACVDQTTHAAFTHAPELAGRLGEVPEQGLGHGVPVPSLLRAPSTSMDPPAARPRRSPLRVDGQPRCNAHRGQVGGVFAKSATT